VEGEGEEAEALGCAFAGAHGGADFAGSGEEDEDVAIEGSAFEGGGHLFFERLRGVGRVFDGGFEEAARALNERQAAEGFGVEGGGHDDEAEVGAGGFLEAAEEGEGGVAFEVAFVEFVEDDDIDAAEVGIAEEAACEDAFGDIAEAGAGAGVFVEADLVADEAAEGFAEFLGDAAGGHAGGHAAGFEDEDAAEGKEGRGDAGGFAGAGGGFEDEDGLGADAVHDFGQQGVDGQRLGQAVKLTIMPELPDVTVYVEAIQARVLGAKLERVRLGSPFLLRTVEPRLEETFGREVREVRRVGKRIALGVEGGLWLVIHLMIAGRLHWKKAGVKLAGRNMLAAFDFPGGTMTLTEAGSQRRASLAVVRDLAGVDPGGIEVMTCRREEFRERLRRENHTLKRALTDPRLFSGIGNAYSDEILHRARLSPLALTKKLAEEEMDRLLESARAVLAEWVERLRGPEFPEGVTAFREEMAVHGKYGKPCPDCGAPVQRIRYAANECNYCARCQTGGKLLADRAMSRLLGEDRPRTLEELMA
jgi:formamidopyrimidine-DNA glycosylase